jgi:hypothetical protein
MNTTISKLKVLISNRNEGLLNIWYQKQNYSNEYLTPTCICHLEDCNPKSSTWLILLALLGSKLNVGVVLSKILFVQVTELD